MPDQRTRELERRWREGGDPADGAAWLKARLRTGELTPERLELAACLGDPAAREASAADPSAARDLREDPLAWLEVLRSAGAEAALRGAIAAAWSLVPAWEQALAGNKRVHRARHALEAAEAWLLDASPARRTAARHCQERLMTGGTRPWREADPKVRAAWRATLAVLNTVLDEEGASSAEADRGVVDALRAAASVCSWEATTGAVLAEVAPWLLGASDPLADRVAARARSHAALRATWERTRDPGDAAALLRARLEVGEIERGALRLAAYVGDEAADQALRAVGELPSAIPDDLTTWLLRTMAYGGLSAPVAAFLAIGRRLVDDPADPALAATAAWVAEPTPEHAAACLAAAAEASPVARLVPAAVAAVGLGEHRERRTALSHLLERLRGHAAAAGLEDADLRTAVRDALTAGLLE